MPAPDPIIPFGKFKGQRCSQVTDVKYLDWLLGLDDLREPFKSELLKHLQSRPEWRELDEE